MVLDYLLKIDLDKKITEYINNQKTNYSPLNYKIDVINSKSIEELNFSEYNKKVQISEQSNNFWNQNVI